MSVYDIHDHMAYTHSCGSVHFNLLRSGLIECAGCGETLEHTVNYQAKTTCNHPPGWISCNVCGALSDEAPCAAPVWATCPKCKNHERCEEHGCADRAATAPAPMQDECPKCCSIEWDRISAERGRERDVPFNRCCHCGNEWEAD